MAISHSARLSPLQGETVWTLDGDALPLVDVVVDGILGSGATGAPRDTAAAAIRAIRQCGRDALVVAIDAPSGLDADSGMLQEPHVRADVQVHSMTELAAAAGA